MTNEQKQVREFMEKYKQWTRDKAQLIPFTESHVRLKFHREEHLELNTAMAEHDLIGIADALGDLIYVILGTACAYGIDLEPVFQEIHRSNMTKQGKDSSGKVMKGDNYSPPDIERMLEEQG